MAGFNAYNTYYLPAIIEIINFNNPQITLQDLGANGQLDWALALTNFFDTLSRTGYYDRHGQLRVTLKYPIAAVDPYVNEVATVGIPAYNTGSPCFIIDMAPA